jgi:hypothetical protein
MAWVICFPLGEKKPAGQTMRAKKTDSNEVGCGVPTFAGGWRYLSAVQCKEPTGLSLGGFMVGSKAYGWFEAQLRIQMDGLPSSHGPAVSSTERIECCRL